MKTIVEEASSIFKALEKGWAKAGKPESFSVKIYEQPQKNFIGMTTRSAKVGIFFNNEPVAPVRTERFAKKEQRPIASQPERTERPQKKERPEQRPHKQEKHGAPQPKSHYTQQKPQRPAPAPVHQAPVETQERTHQEFWTPEMIEMSNGWLNTTLDIMNLMQQFTIEPAGHQLRILLSKPLFDSPEKERQMLRSVSILLLQALRHKFSRPLRGFKIILVSTHDTSPR